MMWLKAPEDIERTLSSNILTKVCFFFHQRVKFEHIYLTNAVKTKTEKGYLTLRGKDAKYFVQKGEKHLYSYNKSTSIPYFSQYVA